MTITRTSTGYAGKINGCPFTVTVTPGQIRVEGRAGHFLNAGESRQIVRAVKQREAQPLFHQSADTKALS